MSNPSFSNIDLWLFELAEGNLSPEQIEQLELFLLNHPELDVDRDVWEMAKVDKIPVEYPEAANLQKKRRPVAAFAFAALFLLLIGTGSFMAWNGNFNSFSESDLQAQNAQVKSLLQQRVKELQSQTRNQGATDGLAEHVAFGKLSLNDIEELTHGNADNSTIFNGVTTNSETAQTFIAGTNPTTSENGNSNGFTNGSSTINSTIAIIPHSNGSNNFELSQNVTAQAFNNSENVTNSQNSSYDSELSDRLANTDEVGEKNFYVREPSEVKIYEGRVWKEPKSTWSDRSVGSSSGSSSRKSFKDRFNKFTRSLERMMNSPIALKNSRDPHYHVPGKTANDINFSSAGTLIATRVQTMSRLQWQGEANEQLMNQISADGYSYGMRGGWGVQLNHQWYQDGGIQVAQAAFTYSPKISVSNWFSIEPSVRVKMGNKRLNSEVMQSTDAVEIDRGNTREFYANGAAPIGRSLWYKDLGLGLLVNTKWFFAGVQGDNLFRYKDNLYSTNWSDPRRAENQFTATLGSDWVSRNEKLSLSPYVVYQHNENLSEVWAGANFAYKWFNIGVATSNNLEPAASIGMKFDHFSMHYNADYTQSTMLNKKALSHQLTIRFIANSSSVNKRLFKR
jgi:hypothetical protein